MGRSWPPARDLPALGFRALLPTLSSDDPESVARVGILPCFKSNVTTLLEAQGARHSIYLHGLIVPMPRDGSFR